MVLNAVMFDRSNPAVEIACEADTHSRTRTGCCYLAYVQDMNE
jgi:hypothetical protein